MDIDIGATVAVVGVNGWRCCLCNTTFPRLFSIDHHMHTKHSPLPQQAVQTQALTPSFIDGSSAPASISPQQSVQEPQASSSLYTLARTGIPDHTQGGNGPTGRDYSTRAGNAEGVSSTGAITMGSVSPSQPKAGLDKVEKSQSTVSYDCNKSSADQSNTEHSVTVKEEPVSDGVFCQAGVRSKERDLPNEMSWQSECHSRSQALIHGPDHFREEGCLMSTQSQVTGQGASILKHNKSSALPAESMVWPPDLTEEMYYNPNTVMAEKMKSLLASRKQAAGFKPIKHRICSCKQVFDTKQSYKQHRRMAHCTVYQKIFTCPICRAHYQYKRCLNRHLALKGEVAFTCSQCSRRFHDQHSLDVHKVECHQNQDSHKGFKGRGCEKRCKDPWECSKCKKQFLKKHEFRNHLMECGILRWDRNGQRSFHCNLCDFVFQWLGEFHQHYVNDHKIHSSVINSNSSATAESSPFMGNSPVASPCPSVTSEINSAMAGVDLNPSSISSALEKETSITDQAAVNPWSLNASMRDLVRQEEDSVTSSNPQSLTSETGSSELCREPDSDIILLDDSEDSKSSDSDTNDWEILSEENSSERSKGQEGQPQAGDGDELSITHASSAANTPPSSAPLPCSRSSTFRLSPPPPPLHPPPIDCHAPPPPPPPHHNPPPSPPPHHNHPPPPHHNHPPPPPPPPFPPGSCHSHFGPRGVEDFHSRPFHFKGPFHWHHGHHGHQFQRHPHSHHRFGWGNFFRGRGRRGGFAFHAWDNFDTNNTGGPAPATQTQGDNSAQTNPWTRGSFGTETSQIDGVDEIKDCFGPSGESLEEDNKCGDSCLSSWQLCALKRLRQKFGNKEPMLRGACWFILKASRHGKPIYLCPDCLQVFQNELDLDRHSSEKHSVQTEYTCPFCQVKVKSALAFNHHARQHNENLLTEKQHSWRIAEGFHNSRRKQTMNAEDHSEPDCEMQGTGHEGEDSGSDGFNYKECPFCQKKFRAYSRQNFFVRHVNSHFGVDTFNYKCDVQDCGKTFLEKAKYTAHMAAHNSPSSYVCGECGKSYQNKTSLTRHQRIHTGERPYKCPECGEGFFEHRELVRHLSVHTGVAPFQCELCGKGFTLKATLLIHMRKKHPGQNAFECTGCGEGFVSSKALHKHRRNCFGRSDDRVSANQLMDETKESAGGGVKEEPICIDIDPSITD